ncbi:hypothetical protein DP939_40635 [Spongiactinospora rosea]|uniref:Peptidase C51 domain-containing protein n=1 Tax=Spongiactinospora rosea TaxID=2248750 RepID=A0A366LKG1_9ACTN|nr:CHAP domain-containing protein [Spongiactinospora rosea]RBQ14416.1 hypothetical protein DP939_40635 [Spongiactinospora rosea]
MSPETEKFIKLLEKQLGYAEKKGGHTKFGAWYNSVESDADYSAQPWCDMYLSWAAKKLGYEEWIGQFAWTPSHARWFEKQGAFGTKPEPGALVFYDWSGGKKIGGIDHVGVVTGVKGRKILTIEGNIDGGIAKRKKRDQDKVVGYGYPEKVKEALEAPVMPPDSVLGQAGQDAAMPQGPQGPQVNVAPDIAARLISPRPFEPSRDKPAPRVPARESSAPSKPATAKAAPRNPLPKASPPSAPADDDRAAPARSSAPDPAPRTKALPDTAPLTGSPLSAPSALQSPLPDLSSPVLLAPVLLAAIGLLAHARSRRLRVQAATGLTVRPAESAATPPASPEPALAAAPALRHAPSAARHASAMGEPARTAGGRAGRTSRTRGRHAAQPDLIIAHDVQAVAPGRHATGKAPAGEDRHTPYRGRRRRVVASDDHVSPAVAEQAPRGRRHRPVPSPRSPLPADRHPEWNWFHPAATAPPNRPPRPLHDPPHATRRGRHARP